MMDEECIHFGNNPKSLQWQSDHFSSKDKNSLPSLSKLTFSKLNN